MLCQPGQHSCQYLLLALLSQSSQLPFTIKASVSEALFQNSVLAVAFQCKYDLTNVLDNCHF